MGAKIYFEEGDDLLDICRDKVFKAVFARGTTESNRALSGLVSALIERKVSIVVVNANEPPVSSMLDRQVRFDIKCRAENGELVNVEMTLNADAFEPVRLEFYAGRLFTGQDIRGRKKTYGDLKRAYQVTILGKERFFKDRAFLHTFEYYDRWHRTALGGRSRIVTLELSKLGKAVEKPAAKMKAHEHWGIFLKYLTDRERRGKINEIIGQEEGIAMASKVLMTISKDEVERAWLESEEKYQLDMQSKMVYMERLAEKRGKKKGRKEGEEEGEKRIIDLLKSGKSPEEIIRSYEGRKGE